MSTHRDQVCALLRVVTVHSHSSYSWHGKQVYQLPRSLYRKLSKRNARGYLCFSLKAQLYRDFYCQGAETLANGGHEVGFAAEGLASFVQHLSDSNLSTGYLDQGWNIHSQSDSRIVVSNGELQLCLEREDIVLAPGAEEREGEPVAVRLPKEMFGISPGFYTATGNEPLELEPSDKVVRLYWNLLPEGAGRLIYRTTSSFNKAHIPFRLKVINDPGRFSRCDAGVLYIRGKDYPLAITHIESIYGALVKCLKPATPVFTKELAPGLGFAEDPGPTESFGLYRCRMLAEGIVRAFEQAKHAEREKLAVVEEVFAENAIDLDWPYLNPGSNDDYVFVPTRTELLPAGPNYPKCSRPAVEPEECLAMAAQIGGDLCQDAIWCGEICNWSGALPIVSGEAMGLGSLTYKTLGADLYSGTSGIALLLGELWRATGDAIVRRTALGAIEHAFSTVSAIAPELHMSFYTGWIGIAFSAARLAELLEREDLLFRAQELTEYCLSQASEPPTFDLLSGKAGTIAGLILLRRCFQDDSLLDHATHLGDALIRSASESGLGMSWESDGFPCTQNLTGLAHGAAGAGYALMELYHVTDVPRFRSAAESAFEYERHCFEPEIGNWPDYRAYDGLRTKAKGAASFATAWCHGAPGIAISRVRAYEVLKDQSYRDEVRAAHATTRRSIEAWLGSEASNFSLCHGLAGNAEIFDYCSRALGLIEAEAALEVAGKGILKYGKPEREWPCGVPAGYTPSLMLGVGGTAYFYLRLARSSVPSLLVLFEGSEVA